LKIELVVGFFPNIPKAFFIIIDIIVVAENINEIFYRTIVALASETFFFSIRTVYFFDKVIHIDLVARCRRGYSDIFLIVLVPRL